MLVSIRRNEQERGYSTNGFASITSRTPLSKPASSHLTNSSNNRNTDSPKTWHVSAKPWRLWLLSTRRF